MRKLDPINLHIGQRLHMARCTKKMSQADLAQRFDVTIAQLQKYEKGKESITGCLLFCAARALHVKEQFFFEDYDDNARLLYKIPELDLELLYLIQKLTRKQRQHLLVLMKDLGA